MSVSDFRSAKNAPDAEVIEGLKIALTLAESGELRSFVLTGQLVGGNAYTNWVTHEGITALGQLAILKHDILNALPKASRGDKI